jgi:tRNA threonylcarbamoyladenosine biosynthesis protein TsaE
MSTTLKNLADPNATLELGRSLAQQYGHLPHLILLYGDLGAGKTTLAQGFLSELLPKGILIQSPTYSYMKQYQGIVPLYHFDLYRINSEDELNELGLLEYLTETEALRLVEWPEQAPFLMTMADVVVHLEHNGPTRSAKITTTN